MRSCIDGAGDRWQAMREAVGEYLGYVATLPAGERRRFLGRLATLSLRLRIGLFWRLVRGAWEMRRGDRPRRR